MTSMVIIPFYSLNNLVISGYEILIVQYQVAEEIFELRLLWTKSNSLTMKPHWLAANGCKSSSDQRYRNKDWLMGVKSQIGNPKHGKVKVGKSKHEKEKELHE